MNIVAFNKALPFTLGEEGGFVDDPADHGGRTNRGITQASYDKWRAQHGLSPLDVKGITEDEVHAFYADLWVASHCDDMSLGMACAHFDWSVNHGPHSTYVLQETLQITADGIYGPQTRAALADQDHDDLWREYNKLRRDWYEADVKRDPSQQKFLRGDPPRPGAGWLGRVDRLDAYIERITTPNS